MSLSKLQGYFGNFFQNFEVLTKLLEVQGETTNRTPNKILTDTKANKYKSNVIYKLHKENTRPIHNFYHYLLFCETKI